MLRVKYPPQLGQSDSSGDQQVFGVSQHEPGPLQPGESHVAFSPHLLSVQHSSQRPEQGGAVRHYIIIRHCYS